MRRLLLCCLSCLSIMASIRVEADVFTDGDLVQVNFSPYIIHYNQSKNYNAYPWFTGLEWESASRWEIGGAVFNNSYNQPCGYLYGGKRFILGTPEQHLFLKVTAGPLMGYFKPYDYKIPVNADGIGFAVIPAIGYKYQRLTTQVVILSTSAVMINFAYDLWK